VGYALCQYPAGLLADRFGPRRVLGGALLAWGVGTALTAVVGEPFLLPWLWVLPTLLVLRFFLGVTQAPTYPGAARSVASWVAPAHRGTANALVIAGIGVGSALTPPLLAHLPAAWGWRTALLLSSLPSLVLAAVWLVAGRDAPPPQGRPEPVGRPEAREALGKVLRGNDLWLLTFSYALQGYVSYVFVFWFFQYLVQVRHLDRLEGSWLATMP
jgi:MFS transporter, ACS family, glucarate transporter